MGSPTSSTTIQIESFLPEGQTRTLPTLHGLIYDCGGWILFRDHPKADLACFLIEFPRDICVEIYSCLVSLGLELTGDSHNTLSELCRRTPYLFDLPSRTVKAADPDALEEATDYVCSLEVIQLKLTVRFVAQATPAGESINVA